MTEWVKEDDWGKVKIGETVRLEGVGATTEFVVAYADSVRLNSRMNTFTKAQGWTLYIEATPEPVLPDTDVIAWDGGAYLTYIVQRDPAGTKGGWTMGWYGDLGGRDGARWWTD